MIECNLCGECCKNLVIPVDVKKSEDREFYKIRGFSFKGNTLYLVLPLRCPHLTMDNKCDLHENKPILCKSYPKNVPFIFIPEKCIIKKDLISKMKTAIEGKNES